MPLSYPLFIAAYAVSMIVGIFAGLLIFIGWKDLWWRKALASAKLNLGYVMLLAVLPLTTLVENAIRNPEEATEEVIYTNWIFSISGDAIRVLQDRLDYQILVDMSIVVYVWIFTFILYFTPILLLCLDDRATIKRYSVAMLFNYVVLIPFYLFFPVTVTGFYSDSGLTPLLYINTNWGRVVTSVDPLNNDFPSGHVSIVLTTMLVLASAGWDRRGYVYFLAASVVGIVFAVLYLGVHWLADVFAGLVLAVGATMLAGNEKVLAAVDRQVRRVSARLVGDQDGAGGPT
ncbi:MAG: phosphatase PAP2 family protein [Candidatus Thermoplasmatota archaeon]